MGLEDALEELLLDMVNAVGSTILDGVAGFFPEIAREECPNCEECYSLCPTGALPSHYALAEARHSA